ncbi:4'-phosphopantetheinyl transferase superfamily protein, partial [Desulfobacterales bacterium]|nr:4'-phosphopantetheinyl transferase superfamily protein [Desulfobacterales bacterium]
MTIKIDDIAASLKHSKNTEVHLWVANYFDVMGHIERLKTLLSFCEQERADAFHFKRDYVRYIYAHALLRLVLKLYTGLPPENLNFFTNASGKPFLSNNEDIQFNLSHTKNLVAIAISPGFQIGVDVEKCILFDDIDDVSKQIMISNEYKRFKELDKNRQVKFFFKCWVRKEAVVKAWGTGIEQNLSEIRVFEGLLTESPAILYTNQKVGQGAWRVED